MSKTLKKVYEDHEKTNQMSVSEKSIELTKETQRRTARGHERERERHIMQGVKT